MIEPISVCIPTAIAMTGLSRSRIYELELARAIVDRLHEAEPSVDTDQLTLPI